MSKYDEYNYNIKIEENNKIDNINNIKYINDDFIYKEEIDYVKINKYNDITSFSDLISSIQSGRRNRSNNLSAQQLQTSRQLLSGQSQQQGQSQRSINQTSISQSSTPQTTSQQTSTSQTTVQQTTASQTITSQSTTSQQTLNSRTATTGWSPTSIAGTVYKFNRGVVGIDRDGNVTERVLDGTGDHHSEVTAEIGNLTNLSPTERYTRPFENGLLASEGGTLIIQLEGDSALVYLPNELTDEQLTKLNLEITPRSNFAISFTHDGNIYEDDNINGQVLISFCQNLVGRLSRSSR